MAFEFVLDLKDLVTGPAEAITKAVEKTTKGFEKLAKSAQGVDKLIGTFEQGHDELGRFTEGTGTISETLEGLAGPAGIAVGAITALGSAFVAATVAGADMAIEAVEAKEKMLASFSALAGGEAAGQQTLNMIRGLEKEVPTSEKQLGEWATALLGAGVGVGKLQGALKAVAASEALVAGGGEKTKSVLEKLNEAGIKGSKIKFSTATLAGTGVTEQELMKALGLTPKQLELAKKQGTLTGAQISDAMISVLQTKGAGPLEAQTNSLAAQWGRFKEDVMKMFEDIDVKPFLDELKNLGQIFSQDTSSGKAMKAGITGFFNEVFKLAAKVLPYIERGILHLIIIGLKMYLFFKEHWTTIGKLLKGAAIAMGIVVAVFAALAAGAVAVAATFAAIPFALVALVGAIGYFVVKAGKALAGWVSDAIDGARDFVVGIVDKIRSGVGAMIDAVTGLFAGPLKLMLDWDKKGLDIAKNFVGGLVDGIKNGAGFVLDAVKSLGKNMLGGIKSMLGISSPSKEMAKIGIYTGQGFAQGVTAANDNVAAAGQGMSAAVAGGASAPAAPSGGGGANVNVSITVNAGGGGGAAGGGAPSAQEIADAVSKAVVDTFETLALTQGLGTAA